MAVKFLPISLAIAEGRWGAFRAEIAQAARLPGARLVLVQDVVELEDHSVLIGPCIDGPDLGRIIQDRRALLRGMPKPAPLPQATLNERDYLRRALGWLDQVIDTLAILHQADAIHGDVKPANCLLDRQGVMWLTDLGLMRLVSQGGNVWVTELPRSRLISKQAPPVPVLRIVNPGFIPPEQWEGRNGLDQKADVFSLGVTLYQLLTLELPYGISPVSSRKPLPPSPSQRQPLLPAALDPVILKALMPDRAKRYPSIVALREDWLRLRR